VLTINGRIELRRRWWHSDCDGSTAPSDDLIDRRGQTITTSVIEMAARLNNDGKSFDSAAENLVRTAQLKMSGEQLRKLVIAAGKAIIEGQRTGEIATSFQAVDCRADPAEASSPSRIYTGVDGVMVPAVTDSEKIKRREKIKQRRQRSGKKCQPLPPRRRGTNEAFKEFKAIVFYDEAGEHWHERLTRARWSGVGPLVRREAQRLGFAQADEKIANVDGALHIRNQLTAIPHKLPLDGLGLDFYHLAENVHKSRRVVYGGDSKVGQEWADQLLHTLKHDGYEKAFEMLLEWRRPLRGKRRKEGDTLDQLCGRSSGHDQLPGVCFARMANWEWPDRIPLQNKYVASKRPRPSLGPTQRRGHRRSDNAERQQPMALRLANSKNHKNLTPPGFVARPDCVRIVR
jgi:hypothetical protein